jgi:hypothetical protein
MFSFVLMFVNFQLTLWVSALPQIVMTLISDLICLFNLKLCCFCVAALTDYVYSFCDVLL